MLLKKNREARKAMSRMKDLTLLRLKFACSIISGDRVIFNKAQREVEKKGFTELNWITKATIKSLREAMGSKGRHLLVSALAASINDGEVTAVSEILEYASEHRIMLHISTATA